MKKLFSLVIALTFALIAVAQPANYYNSANGLTGHQLKVALHGIIKGHTSISYAQLWNAFWSTDNKGNGVVWDMYSDRPNGTPPYVYYLGQDQCGNYSGEGDCYNREHSWPQSWFNNDATARTDLHHIFPVDGWVNNKRANFAFGEVGSASWTSQNGSKLGSCKTPGFSGTVFEPIDEYKGDFARAIMYMSVRYYTEDGSWSSSDMTTKSEIQPWAIDLLLRWNEQDPVSDKEKERNEAIYNDYQYNRNPFVDHPEYARMIWDPSWSIAEEGNEAVYLFPNPVERGQTLHISGNCDTFDAVALCDLCGRTLMKASGHAVGEFTVTLPADLAKGCYIVKLMRNGCVVKYEKLMVK
ncbi:MAG: endonuclease [Bacteroidales bacterium]|nr:endonuclease [Bacteroidales bacterium]